MDRARVAVYHRIQSSTSVLSHPADSSLSFSQETAMGAKIAPHVGSRVRSMAVCYLQRLFQVTMARGAVECSLFEHRDVVSCLNRPLCRGAWQGMLHRCSRLPLPPSPLTQSCSGSQPAGCPRTGYCDELSTREPLHCAAWLYCSLWKYSCQ